METHSKNEIQKLYDDFWKLAPDTILEKIKKEIGDKISKEDKNSLYELEAWCYYRMGNYNLAYETIQKASNDSLNAILCIICIQMKSDTHFNIDYFNNQISLILVSDIFDSPFLDQFYIYTLTKVIYFVHFCDPDININFKTVDKLICFAHRIIKDYQKEDGICELILKCANYHLYKIRTIKDNFQAIGMLHIGIFLQSKRDDKSKNWKLHLLHSNLTNAYEFVNNVHLAYQHAQISCKFYEKHLHSIKDSIKLQQYKNLYILIKHTVSRLKNKLKEF